jgi:predicted TPR repeat methyltransferase
MHQSEYANIFENETTYWWYLVLHRLVADVVRSNTTGKETRILDAGCGTGGMMKILEKYGQVEGFDFSEEAVRLAKSRGLTQVTRQDLNSWHSSKTYDFIVSLDVLYHEGVENDIEVLRRFYEALNDGGTLILNLAAFELLRRPHDFIVHTRRRYRKKTLAKELKSIGFNIEKATYRLPHLFFLILISKVFSAKQNREDKRSDLHKIQRWLNRFLYFLGIVENKLILAGLTFPVGSSLFVVAKKQTP